MGRMENSLKIYGEYPSYQLLKSRVVDDTCCSNFKFQEII
jgi:hypothetical protein